MSADAQPRKRKDKKKKKDEKLDPIGEKWASASAPPPSMATPVPPTPIGNLSADEIMHVYKEGKVGGNMITKILFFVIMSGLALTISVVIMQSRDLSADTIAKVEESGVGEGGWSLDMGLGEWSPFTFDDGHEEGHGEEEGHDEEGHDEHGEEGHDEHDEHGDEDHEHEHTEDQTNDGGILSWLGWGGSPSQEEETHNEHSEEHEAEPSSEGLSSWFGWGGGDTVEEPTEEQSQASEQTSSWFGWGGGETKEEEPPEEQEEEEQPEEESKDEPEDVDDAVSEEVVPTPSKKYSYKDEHVERETRRRPTYKEVEEEPDQDDKDDDTPENDDVNASPEQEEEEEDDDDELTTFLRSLDLEPPSRREMRRQAHHQPREPPKQYRYVEPERPPPVRRERFVEQPVENRRYVEEPERPPVRKERHVEPDVEQEVRRSPEIVKKNKPAAIEEDDDDELFPEAAEALRLEKTSAESMVESPSEGSPADDEEEEAPFSRDEEPSDDMAEGGGGQGGAKEEASGKVEEVEDEDYPRLVLQSTQAPPSSAPSQPADLPKPTVHERVDEPVKEKPFESKVKPVVGSAAAKASEFLAERAAERAAYQAPVVKEAVREPPISFPPPPSLTPEPSDEEELSDPELQYSNDEELGEEEELVEEEEKLLDDLEEEEEEEELGNSPLGSDIDLNLEGSEPEMEEEEEEEEEEEVEGSDDEVATPAPTPTKKPTSTYDSTPSPRQQYDRRSGGPQAYEHEDITDDYDWNIKDELDTADDEFHRSPSGCLHVYQNLQTKYANSGRAHVGVAKCLDHLAKEANSNRLLESAIQAYRRALKLPLKDKLFLDAAQRLINRLRFRGFIDQTIDVHELIISRFKDDVKHRNDLAISYLMMNKLKDAEKILNVTLNTWPEDAVACAHYGLALKLQGKHDEGIPHLERGINLDEQATKDARFYFHLGDALVRTGQQDKAEKVYEKGVSLGMFRSKYQRSLYNIDRLKARPWWTPQETTYSDFINKLETNWRIIRDEGLRAIDYKKGFLDEAESLRDTGDWKQFELYARGVRNAANCEIARFTCRLIGEFEAARGCRRGQAKFSLMEGGTHVWPHCGPTNCRLRSHLGLVVPPGPQIRVANITRIWIEGKVVIFDDSFEHEVWHRGSEPRLVLIVDVWHPEITQAERRTLSPI